MNLVRIPLGSGILFAACIALSTLHPWGNPRNDVSERAPLLEGSAAPDRVRGVLATKCGDCHSESTHYPLYAHIAPVSWLMEREIEAGRASLNLSQWQFMSDLSRISVLTRIASVAHTGQMPPDAYVAVHRGTRLSQDERQEIYAWAKAERKRLREQSNQGSNESLAPAEMEKR